MEFKATYNPLGMQIEGDIRKEYENNLQNLKQANSLEESLESIRVMFKYLGKSHPQHGKGVDWTRDMVEAYRTLGEIFNSACSELESQAYNTDIERLAENYENLLDNFDENNFEDYDKIDKALEHLTKLNEVLAEYDLTAAELGPKLERLNELEETQENIEELEELKRKMKEIEDNF